MLSYITLFSALLVATISGYISILGLTTLFSLNSAFYVIVAISISLEIGKLVSVAWLHRYWKHINTFVKSYFIFIIIIVMFLNMISSFGFLSKAHIEQQVNMNNGAKEQIEILNFQIKIKEDGITSIDRQLEQINAAVEKLTERGQARTSLSASDSQKRNRDTLLKNKQEEIKALSELKTQKIKYESEFRKIEAEVGPIKYVAELIYGESGTTVIDKAVRFVIIIIIFVFDPLAILLLVAFNISISVKENYADMEFVEIKVKDKPKRRRKETANTSATLPLEGGTF